MVEEWNQPLKDRKDFERLALHFLNPLIPCYGDYKARLDLGNTGAVYEQEAVWAEAFLRPLWGLVPLWAGGSELSAFQNIYQQGLGVGTDPSHPEYFGGFHDVDQRFVEMASIALGILMTPDIIWDPLTKVEKNQLATWLDGINHYDCPPCNWMFFGILVNIALKSQGMKYSQNRLEEYLDYIESCYEGNGWYVDGQNGEKDYYVSFAFHFYGLIYARYRKKEDEKRCKEYEVRATIFSKEFLYWFEEDGPALVYGRSLTYRFAQVSFFSMCVSCELQVLPYGVMKGIISRHFRYWMKQPITDRCGILTIGYGYPNLLMSEQYNAPGSPYWSMKAFALLSLPEDHEFWNIKEEPFPEMESIYHISNGSMTIQRLHGHVNGFVTGRTLPHHHVHMEEKYSKFVYSSQYGFSVPRSYRTIEEAAPDSVLSVVHQNMVYTKGITTNHYKRGENTVMEWSPCNGVYITTEILLLPNGHRRIHEIKSEFACVAYDCGFAIPLGAEGSHEVKRKKGNGKEMMIHASPNTNLMYPKTVIPSVCYAIAPGWQCVISDFLETSII